MLLSGGALRAGAPDVAVHIKEQEAGSLIQEACRGERAMPQRRGGRRRVQRVDGGGAKDMKVGGLGLLVTNMLEVTLITYLRKCGKDAASLFV